MRAPTIAFSLRRLAPLGALLAFAAVAAARADQPADPPGRVGRVNLTQGAVSLQPAGAETWVSDVLNRPLTNGDKVWADRDSRAEMHIGSSAVRLGAETGLAVLNIDDRTVQLKLSAGTLEVRVRALGPDQTFEIATPNASVAVLRPGDYRIEVGEDDGTLRVGVGHGQVAVTDSTGEATVGDGELAVYTGGGVAQSSVGALPAGDDFDQWVAERDRREDRAPSTRYVSRDMIGYEDLDDYGAWRNVEDYGPVWVPTVAVGWAPYRYGHWGWIAPWGWTWIDDAPWGFAPFHYGRWVSVGGAWCWAPGPRRVAPVYAPALVGWVGGPHFAVGIGVGVAVGGPPVGWFPLGWNEVYVPGYRVSNAYVRNVNVTNIHVTNTTINNYITNNTTIVNGVPQATGNPRYANAAVAGAVTATSQSNFASAQPVATHLAKVPHEALEHPTFVSGAPAIAPTARSLGRAAPPPPHVAPAVFNRPVVARTPPPPPPPSFEAQRHAIVANGGRPVPLRAMAPARAGGVPTAPRADVITLPPRAPSAAAPAMPARPNASPTPPATRAVPPSAPVARPPRQDRPPGAVESLPNQPPARPVTPSAPVARPPRQDRPPGAVGNESRPTAPAARPEQPSAPLARPVQPSAPPARPQREDRPQNAVRSEPRPVSSPSYRPPAPENRPAPPPENRPAPVRPAPPARESAPPPPHESHPPPPRQEHKPEPRDKR